MNKKLRMVLIIVAVFVAWAVSFVGAALFGYEVGYEDAMKEVEARVMQGIESMNIFGDE